MCPCILGNAGHKVPAPRVRRLPWLHDAANARPFVACITNLHPRLSASTITSMHPVHASPPPSPPPIFSSASHQPPGATLPPTHRLSSRRPHCRTALPQVMTCHSSPEVSVMRPCPWLKPLHWPAQSVGSLPAGLRETAEHHEVDQLLALAASILSAASRDESVAAT